MKLSDYAKSLGVCYKTAWNMWKRGELDAYQLPSGTIIVKNNITVDILPGLKAPGNNRALAPRRVDISQAAVTLAVVLCLPTCPFKVSVCPPATNIFLAAFSSLSCLAPQLKHSHSRIDKSNFPPRNPQQEQI